MPTSNQSYSYFKLNPYHREGPLFSSQTLRLDTGKEKATLHLDINKKDIVSAMYYELDGDEFWSPFFSFLCFYCEGRKIEDLLLLDTNFLSSWSNEELELPMISLPLLMLSRVIYIFKGEAPSYAEISGESQDTLYCRCFGVYESSLVDLLLDHPHEDIKFFSDQTKAGAGCSSCTSDIKSLIQRVRDRLAMVPDEGDYQRARPLGKTPVEFSFFLQRELDKLQREAQFKKYDFKLNAVKNYDVTLKLSSEKNLAELELKLNHYFFNEHELKLSFCFII